MIELEKTNIETSVLQRLGLYVQLLKMRLTLLVVFSGSIAYTLASNTIDFKQFLLFCLGGIFVTGSANIINQIIEVDFDKLMTRTMNRPLPTGSLSVLEAKVFAIVLGLLGLYIHFIEFNVLTGVLSLISLILYAFVYTPLKRVGPIAVFVGAFPGALPPLIGWVAVSNSITYEALILFGIQFIWQFPHFWAIAWVAYEDYAKAGFKLLPSSGGRDLNTAFNIMIYTLFLIPVSLLPVYIGLTGSVSAVIVTVAGVLFLAQTFYLMKNQDRQAALRMMFGSFLYLPVVQIAFVLDKI